MTWNEETRRLTIALRNRLRLFRQHLFHPADTRKPAHTNDLLCSLCHARYQFLGGDRSSIGADYMGE